MDTLRIRAWVERCPSCPVSRSGDMVEIQSSPGWWVRKRKKELSLRRTDRWHPVGEPIGTPDSRTKIESSLVYAWVSDRRRSKTISRLERSREIALPSWPRHAPFTPHQPASPSALLSPFNGSSPRPSCPRLLPSRGSFFCAECPVTAARGPLHRTDEGDTSHKRYKAHLTSCPRYC